MAFTPGPWRYFDPMGDNVGDENDYFEIQSASHSENEIPDVDLTGFLGEPNARLIAASPDLLLALEALLQWFRPSEDTEDADDPAVAAARQAHAAVKLARGE